MTMLPHKYMRFIVVLSFVSSSLTAQYLRPRARFKLWNHNREDCYN